MKALLHILRNGYPINIHHASIRRYFPEGGLCVRLLDNAETREYPETVAGLTAALAWVHERTHELKSELAATI